MLDLTRAIIKQHNTYETIPILYEKNIDIPVNEWWCLKENSDIWFSHKELDVNDFYVKWIVPSDVTSIQINWIIWGDQILRHPFKNLDKEIVNNHRFTLYEDLYKISKQLLQQKEKRLDDAELVFTLLVIRHDKNIQSKKFVIDYIKNRIISLLDFKLSVPSLYYRFLNTSLKDYMSCLTIDDLKYNRIPLRLDYNDILEFIPDKQLDIDFELDKIKNSNVYKNFCFTLEKCDSIIKRDDKLTVSISGGVDSMVLSLCAYVYCLENNIQLNLIHIQYNNRDCCDKEVKFLYDWTTTTIRTSNLYVRNITEIKRRRETEWRELYENITREFRFNAYSLVGGVVLLGHNYEDTVENIITNIASQTHTDNLKGMKYLTKENKIDICRPFLNISKKEIIEFAHCFNIPYLQDSTPCWSKRGQIRDSIIPILDKFDNNFIKGLYDLSSAISFYKNEWNINANQWCELNITEQQMMMTLTNKKQNICAERIFKVKIDDYLIRNNEKIWIYIWNKYLINYKIPSRKSTSRLLDSIAISKKKMLARSFPLNKQIYILINLDEIFIYANFSITTFTKKNNK
jgi:tRNA(Ile)-lysidine synthetase-like protein